jgi:hypothetical protein
MAITNDSLKKKTAINTVVYGIASVIAGGIGITLLVTNNAPILGIGLILFGIAGFGWSCAARDWFFKSKTKSKIPQ